MHSLQGSLDIESPFAGNSMQLPELISAHHAAPVYPLQQPQPVSGSSHMPQGPFQTASGPFQAARLQTLPELSQPSSSQNPLTPLPNTHNQMGAVGHTPSTSTSKSKLASLVLRYVHYLLHRQAPADVWIKIHGISNVCTSPMSYVQKLPGVCLKHTAASN